MRRVLQSCCVESGGGDASQRVAKPVPGLSSASSADIESLVHSHATRPRQSLARAAIVGELAQTSLVEALWSTAVKCSSTGSGALNEMTQEPSCAHQLQLQPHWRTEPERHQCHGFTERASCVLEYSFGGLHTAGRRLQEDDRPHNVSKCAARKCGIGVSGLQVESCRRCEGEMKCIGMSQIGREGSGRQLAASGRR